MQSRKEKHSHVLVFKRGEEIVSGITDYVQTENITAGSLTGIGAASEVELRYYDISRRDYMSKRFRGMFEIASLTGTLSLLHSKPWPHIHGVFTGTEFTAFGGHVQSAVVSVTCEVIINVLDTAIERSQDEETGLQTMVL